MQGWVSNVRTLEQQEISFAAGVNTSVSPSDMQPGQLSRAENVDSYFAPTIATKRGVAQTVPTGIGQADGFVSYTSRVFAGTRSGIYYVAQGGNQQNLFISNGFQQIFNTPDNPSNRWSFAVYLQKNIILFLYDNRVDVPRLRKYNGSQVSEIATAPTGLEIVTTYANRIIMAGSREPEKAISLYLSGLADENDWSSTDAYVGSAVLKLPESDGSGITALVTYNGQLMIFTSSQAFVLYGQDSTNFQITKLFDVGCVGARAIKEIDGTLYWIAQEGIYRYAGGFPTLISDVLRPDLFPISSQNPTGSYSKLDTDGRFLYATLGGDVPVYYRTLKFDLDVGSWWTTTDVISAMLYLKNGLLTSTTDGTLRVMDKSIAPAANVPFDVVTGPVFYKNERVRSALHRLKLIVEVEPGASLNVSYSIGEASENWSIVKQLSNQTGELMMTDIPFIVSAPSPWFRLRFNGAGDVRIHRVTTSYTARGR